MVRVLQIHFGVALGCKGGGGKKKLFRSRKVFSGAGISNRAIGQIFHHARARKFFFWRVLGCKGGGVKETTFQAPKSFCLI